MKTLERVCETLTKSENDIHNAILKEAEMKDKCDFSIQIRKFAHAEQRTLDRIVTDLPMIVNDIKDDNVVINSVRLHMLVNNDSCCRCDAVIKACIAQDGWLHTQLMCAVSELEIKKKKQIELNPKLKISAAISSTNAYNSGENLEIAQDILTFFSRGMTCLNFTTQDKKLVGVPKGLQTDSSTPILKLYGFD